MIRLEDTWRSLKRLVAMAFPSPWQIRLEMAQVSDELRPLIVIDTIGDLARTGVQPTIPGRQHVLAQTFVMTAYPATPDDARAARRDATAALQGFEDLIAAGWVNGSGEDIGGPLRLPIWDYAGVPLTGPDRGNPDWDTEWAQIAWVESHAGRVIGDPQDDRRWTVPYTIRLSWDVASRYVPAPAAARFGGAFVFPPERVVVVPSPPAPAPVWAPLAQGPPGPPGPSGPQGPPGTMAFTGHGPPVAANLPQARAGDRYLDLDSGTVYILQ